MKLELQRLIKKGKQRSYSDNRRMVNMVTAEYLGVDGYIYRKTFESYDIPIVPQFGENKDLTAKRIQWQA